MAIIRKNRSHLSIAIFALGLVAGPLGAQGPLVCTTAAGVPTIIRATGITELVGDLIINCVGGIPTPSGQPIPAVNFQVDLNAAITGRLFPVSLDLSEALMMIDEPFPANPVPSSFPHWYLAPPQILCTNFSTQCAETGTGGSPSPYQTQPNVFVGVQNGVNAVEFNGIPFDPPGPAFGTRVIRIKNIRVNAAALGVSSTLIPTSVSLLVSFNGNSIMPLSQPPGGNVVGIIEPDLISSITTVPTLSQCKPHNASLIGGSGTPHFDFTIQAEEGFASTFKNRNWGYGNYSSNGAVTPPVLNEQNIPGFNYVTESGFYSPSLFTSVPSLGLADFGTRIIVQFQNVSAGTHLFVPVGIIEQGAYCSPGCSPGVLRLVKTGQNGGSQPGYYPVPPTGTVGTDKIAEVTYSGTTAYATYEVTYSDPSVLETATIPVAIAYDSSTVPAAGMATAKLSFAPISSASKASKTAPVPRFVDAATPINAYAINACAATP